MLLRNYTPFSPFYFETEIHDRSLISTFILKATLDVRGDRLVPSQAQQPITMGDEHYGEPTSSSVHRESDLCPHKSTADIFVTGDAIAPRGEPSSRWDVCLSVEGSWGTLGKTLTITGPSEWRKGLLGWQRSRPEPVERVPLRYEYAYGGTFTDQDGHEIRHSPNPVGRGFAPKELRRTVDVIHAPQVFAPGATSPSIKGTPSPEGLGPICKAWESRTDLAGTYDDEWLEHDWPHLPDDFDFDYYLAAHPDLRPAGYLDCDESVRIEGMSDAPFTFRLPQYKIAAYFTMVGDDIPAANLMDLDTMAIDTLARQVTLTWRIATPKREDVREVETRMLIRGERPRGR